jgi:Putative beta-barrel porin-2, OmpL-like. bbp2
MSMQSLRASLVYAGWVHLTMLAFGCAAVGFLVWCLGQFVREDRRIRTTRGKVLRLPSSNAVTSIEEAKRLAAYSHGAAIGARFKRELAHTPTDRSEGVAFNPRRWKVSPENNPAGRGSRNLRRFVTVAFLLGIGSRSYAQPSATPLPTPSITGPLQASPPLTIDGGPLGKLDVDGILSGLGLVQSNHIGGDDSTQTAITNAQVFLQKTTGWWQFYVQAGAYDIPTLGSPFLPTDKTITGFWGPVPVAFIRFIPRKDTSVQIGALPSLMGAESTFDFQNMNIERGLLWNQENSVDRGIQISQTLGKFTASLSWNDGYYSNRYSWLSGSLTYTKGSHSLQFAAMGNLGQTVRPTLATPVENNGSMYALIYAYSKGIWILQAYYQYGSVPTNPRVEVVHGASTDGMAALVTRTFKHGFSIAGRGEYIASTGSVADQAVNLLYGPGSEGLSFTLTPTYQYQRFFARADLSMVRAIGFTAGDAFGVDGRNANQARAVGELGVLF